MNVGMICAILLVLTFFFTVGLSCLLIPALRRRHAGQPILEIGPSWHLSKKGTPTLGGLAFIAAILIASLLYLLLPPLRGESREVRALALMLVYALCCGSIGFFDDYRKLLKKQNQGLSALEKYFLQLLASALFLFLARLVLGVETSIALPFSEQRLELGLFYYPLALLFLTGLVNALNLTDGVDGLLSSTLAVTAAFFLLWGFREQVAITSLTGALLIGATLGFLCFNAHPAKVFMGDTGSLFFGGAVAALGIVTGEALTVLLACGVYVIEAASVMLQVGYFKVSGGKRLLLMAPLHHHFEKKGWSENAVVALFSALAALFGFIAFWGR